MSFLLVILSNGSRKLNYFVTCRADFDLLSSYFSAPFSLLCSRHTYRLYMLTGRECDHALASVNYDQKIPIIVTAANSATFEDLQDTVVSLQTVFPQHKYILLLPIQTV
jgi:hypothetical protein